MLQNVDGTDMYVVDLKRIPRRKIVGTGWEQDYANALNQAIERGLIKGPGKYGIHIDNSTQAWSVFEIIED